MNSTEIQSLIYDWALNQKFTAPYGVLIGEQTSIKGKPYKSITFGYARTLDVHVGVYNRNFIVVRTSNTGSHVFKSYEDAKAFLNTL